MSHKALIAVDVQNDFLPWGALAVPKGDAVIPILELLALTGIRVIATKDAHPPNHQSFKPNGGIWPEHCVSGTVGARIHPRILEIAHRVVSKGVSPESDGYSGFENSDLDLVLKHWDVEEVIIGGLALDYCVKATALDARTCGYDVTVPLLATRAVGDGIEATEELVEAGVHVWRGVRVWQGQ